VAALAIAFGLAFGLGGRDVAARLTEQWYAGASTAASKVRDVVDAQDSAEPSATTSTASTTMAPNRQVIPPTQPSQRPSEEPGL
jgi:hypothetical protein